MPFSYKIFRFFSGVVMKKFLKIFTAFAVFLFIVTACSGKGNSGKEGISDGDAVSDKDDISDDDSENQISDKDEISGTDAESQVSDGDEISDADSENQTPEREEYPGDGTEKYITFTAPYANNSNNESDEYGSPDAEAVVYAGDNSGCSGNSYNYEPKKRNNEAQSAIAEADKYKLDGNSLWLADKYKGLISVDASDPKNLKVLDILKFKGDISEMYIQNGKLYLLVNNTNESLDENGVFSGSTITSKIFVVNAENPTNISVVGELEMNGEITGSRFKGEIIYIAATEYEIDPDTCYPSYRENRVSVMSVDIKDPENIKIIDKDSVSIESCCPNIYISDKSVYVAESMIHERNSVVTKFDIGDSQGKIVKKASFLVEGYINDVSKIYELNDVFYVVSFYSGNSDDSILESFDVSGSETKRLGRLVLMEENLLYQTQFLGNMLYSYDENPALSIIDISDPKNFVKLGAIELPAGEQPVKAIGNHIFVMTHTGFNLYDISDPQKPKEVSQFSVGYGHNSETLDIFESEGLIVYPTGTRIYFVDFDLNRGFRIRGSVVSRTPIERGIVAGNIVFGMSDTEVLSADISDRDNPKLLSDKILAEDISLISKCRENICGQTDLGLSVYNTETDLIWKSSISGNSSAFLKNNNYIYFNRSAYGGTENIKFQVVKINEEPPFEDLGETFIDFYYDYFFINSVSENNVITTRIIDRSNTKNQKIAFLNMNDPGKKVKSVKFDFEYEFLSLLWKEFLTSGSRFWTSGCRLKKADPENGDQYYCYVLPFDAGDPAKPKAEKRINIPGELEAVSDDGKYFYTKTPVINKKYDFYVLETDYANSEANVVRKYTLDSHNVYVKNDVLFLVHVRSYGGWDGCVDDSYNSYDIEVVSAVSGKKLFSGTFEYAKIWDVENGGIAVLQGRDKLYYISKEGKSTQFTFSTDAVWKNTMLLLNDRLYISAGYEGIYSFDVK